MSKRMYHPCHKLSVPSAKLFWCRHCMQMFEDAISRWKHSKKCHASPGYKPKDQDARVVQLYVKPDKVSYTSNVTPGQTVYHKPHVKKTSTDLKCVICGTKFYSLHDMRRHVKEPCQKSETRFASTQIEVSDNEEDTESFSSLKIRRVDSGEEEKSGAETALSVLAEASKHVESLSHTGEVILEQVIEEVPQVIEHFVQTPGDQFAWYEFVDKVAEEKKQPEPEYKEVVVAFPRPQVKPELGTIVVALQSEDGNQLLPDDIELETLRECIKDTASTLSIGQIIQIQLENADKYHHFVVGLNGVIWPLDENSLTSVKQEHIENPAQSKSATPTLVQTEHTNIPKSSLQPPLTQVFTNNIDNNTFNNKDSAELELVKGLVSDSRKFVPQEVVITSEETVQQVDIPYSDQTCTNSIPVENSYQNIPNHEQSLVCGRSNSNIIEAPLIAAQGQLIGVNRVDTTVSQQPCLPLNQEPQAIHRQSGSESESLVEALLRGSVVIAQPTPPQGATEVAIVELTDQHLKALTDHKIQPWPVENM